MPGYLTLRGLPARVLERLRERAAANRRSMNGEAIAILEAGLGAGQPAPAAASPVPTPGTGGPAAPASGVCEPAAPASGAGEPIASYAAADPLASLDLSLLADVCRRHSIRWLAVFGSFARGEARADSDVDVVVEFEPGRTPGWGIVRVADALRSVFGGRRIDLVTVRELGRLHEHVMTSARTLYDAR